MATYLVPAFLESAFNKDFTHIDFEKKPVKLYMHNMGNLHVTDGKIIVCDPFLYNDEMPFEATFPIGKFPVQLAVATIRTDERVAFARINFNEETLPVSWQLAVKPGQDVTTLKKGQIFGFPVDAGTASFMDASAGKAFEKHCEDEDIDEMSEEMEKTYKHTWSWLMADLQGHTIAMFSSGWGDGFYPTFIGLDEEGKICRLVIDFGVIGEEE